MSLQTYGWLVLAFPLGGAVLIGLTFKLLPSRVHGIIGTLAIFLSFLPETLRLFFSLFADPNSAFYTNYVYEIRGAAYGVVIVLFLRFKPEGLIGVWQDARKYWNNWPLAY